MHKFFVLPVLAGAAIAMTVSAAYAERHHGYKNSRGYETTRTMEKQPVHRDAYGRTHQLRQPGTAPNELAPHHHSARHAGDTPYRGGMSDRGDNQARGVNSYVPGKIRVYNEDGTSYLHCPPAQAKKRGC